MVLVEIGGDGEPVWDGRLPEIPAPGTILDVGLGHGPRFLVSAPIELRLKSYAYGGASREHEVAVATIPVSRLPVSFQGVTSG